MPRRAIIHERDALLDPRCLHRRWLEPPTFLLVSDKNSLKLDWPDRFPRLVPAEYGQDCFGLFTSGSTGEPQLILGSRKRAESLVRVLHALQESEPVRETVCALPLSYSYAFVNQWVWAHVFQRTLRLTQGFAAPDTLKEALDQAKDAMLCLVGSQVALIRHYFPTGVFPGIMLCASPLGLFLWMLLGDRTSALEFTAFILGTGFVAIPVAFILSMATEGGDDD